MLEDCTTYLDGTIYNLQAKVTNFDDNHRVIQQMLTMQQQQILQVDYIEDHDKYTGKKQ